MASPPAKRQRRSILVSSEAEDSEAESQLSHASLNVTTRSLSLRNGAQSKKPQGETAPKATNVTKSRASKSKSTTAKGLHVTKNATIYSFFNNATQNSQRTSRPITPQPPEPDPESEEDIDDISSDDTTSQQSLPSLPSLNANGKAGARLLRKGSAVASHTVARGKQFSKPTSRDSPAPDLEPNGSLEPGPWADIYPPKTLEELAVHKRKVSDVHRWLDNVMKGREHKRLLVLRGPSGSGKTTTLRLLAKEIKSELIEWQNPVGNSFENEGFISLATQFDEFLSRTINFQGLELANTDDAKPLSDPEQIQGGSRTIVVIEDFPNTFSRGSLALMNFRDSILRYLANSTPNPHIRAKEAQITPVVMIVTETHMSTSSDHSDSFTVGRLLGRQLMQHPSVTVIDFNPIAPTLLSKALTTIVRKRNAAFSRKWNPSTFVLKQISQSGDIRNSTNSLQLVYLFDQGEPPPSSAKTTSKQDLANKPGNLTSNIAFRDNIVDLFHAVGKVLYNKRKETPSPLIPPPVHLRHYHRPLQSEVSIDNLYEDIGTDIDTFISTLHENYPLSCFGQDFADNLDDCITILSDSELLLSSSLAKATAGGASTTLFQTDYAFNLASRGLLFSLPYPVERGKTMSSALKLKRDPFKMIYPQSLRLWRQIDETESTLDEWIDFILQKEDTDACLRLSRSEIITEFIPYASKILACSKPSRRQKTTGFWADGQDGEADEEFDSSSGLVSSVLEMPLPPSISSNRDKGWSGGTSHGQVILPASGAHLILSDDDIEDD